MGQNGQIGPLNASLTCTLEKPYKIIVKCPSKRNNLVSELPSKIIENGTNWPN